MRNSGEAHRARKFFRDSQRLFGFFSCFRERAEQLLVQLPDVEDVPKLDEAQLPGAVQ